MAGRALIEPKFRCGECGDVHDDEDAALECCPPTVSEVFVCPACHAEQAFEEEAFGCCDVNADPDARPRPSAAELEAAGQKRLF